ncbi:TraM recognition domain-containing protein [Azospirillum melinis]|uniref:TraM recognition domain-containing protein n=1 Tax=Azospirillum melinis TaxID=328839 RepID=A0ABX2KEC3_9PROT|nr:type IV secretory system conjugative DNA transfer family protein [Azospirillum melinis]MBP2307495.1 type IV secretion system protein VirD4 [Azospirillum melinis]NUB01940.1 TraM recognition domain-containing protein [Azospirillum melinis]
MDGFQDWPPAAKALAALVAVLVLALLWSAIASLVFLAGTGLLTADTLPVAQFWLYLQHYGLHHPVAGPWLRLAAATATAVPVLLLLGRLARGGWPRSSRPLHGETHWAGRRALAEAGFYAPGGGLFVGRDRRDRFLRFGGPEHVVCYAPTRSGKGVGLVIPNALLYEASLVCLDVKKETWAATAGIRAAAGQRVVLFDPLAPDGRTARYNPFSYVRRGTVDAFEDIQRIAQMVFPHAGGDQQFWTDAARSAFTGAAGFLAESPELPLTFGEVLRLLSSVDGARSMIERIEARRRRGRPYTEATVKALEDYLKGSPDLVNSIRKTITARLSLWFNPRIDAATAASDFDLRTLRTALHAVYIGVTPDNIARLRPLLALFFQQLIDLTVRTLPQHDPNARHQLLLLLDEFALLGPMPMLADAFAYVAGYNMRLMLILQSKAQLRDRDLYGPDKAAAILDNCGLEVVFGTKDLALCEELSARLGYDTVEGTARSGPRFWRLFRRDRLTRTETDQRRALLLPQEIARLTPRDAILLRPGMEPIRARRIRHFEDPTFTRLLRPAPEVPAIDVPVRLDQGKGFEPIAAEAEAGSLRPPRPVRRRAAQAAGKPRTEETANQTGGDETGASGTDGRPLPPADRPASWTPSAAALRPHQADGLIAAILRTEVDLGAYGLENAQAVVAAIVDAAPTVESPGHSRATDGAPGTAIPSPTPKR